MAATLLIASAARSWRGWLKEHRGNSDLICLDPADPIQGVPGRICLLRGNVPAYYRFYGSLDPMRSPHVLLLALAQALAAAVPNPLVQLFAYRPAPLMRQMAALTSQLCQAGRILVSADAEISPQGLTALPESVEIEKALSTQVQDAQRKAQWMKLMEQSEPHEVDLRSVAIEGARLGSGLALTAQERARIGMADAVHVERTGASLLIVTNHEPDEGAVLRAQDLTHCSRAQVVEPSAYHRLVCSFARQNDEDFGMGFVQSIDWESMRASVLCDAVPPAPLKTLRLGSLRVDLSGREMGEVRPWQV